jgi:hypothetical protein
MLFILLNIIVLGAAAAVSWWLSGYDVNVRGENIIEDHIRRGIRCGFSLFFVEVLFLTAWWSYHGDKFAGFLFLPVLVAFAILWAGCGSELGAGFFHGLIDPPDKRGYYPQKGLRELDAVGDLIRGGHKQEAIQLCQMLLQHSDDNRAALEMTLHHLGVPQPQMKERKPLAEAHRLRQEGKFDQAEMILSALLAENPSNVEAAIMLMRVYTQDMRCQEKAVEILRSLEQQRHVSPAYVEFARRSLEEWQKPRTEEPPAEPIPESLEEMIANNHFGTAVETLQQQVTDEPKNFEAWMKLAEVYGKHCSDLRMAEKIVRQIETNRAFNAEQIRQARSKLGEWRELPLKR